MNTPGLEQHRLPGSRRLPNYKHTGGRDDTGQSAGQRGEGKVPNSPSFPEHSNIYPFPSTFHLRLSQNQTCHRGEQAPASLMLPGCSDVCLLARSHLLSQSSILWRGYRGIKSLDVEFIQKRYFPATPFSPSPSTLKHSSHHLGDSVNVRVIMPHLYRTSLCFSLELRPRGCFFFPSPHALMHFSPVCADVASSDLDLKGFQLLFGSV